MFTSVAPTVAACHMVGTPQSPFRVTQQSRAPAPRPTAGFRPRRLCLRPHTSGRCLSLSVPTFLLCQAGTMPSVSRSHVRAERVKWQSQKTIGGEGDGARRTQRNQQPEHVPGVTAHNTPPMSPGVGRSHSRTPWLPVSPRARRGACGPSESSPALKVCFGPALG